MAGSRGKAVGVGLSPRDMAVLDFERSWWTHDGAKEALVEQQFALSAEDYYRLLNELIDEADALAYDPLGVRRLRRLRARRRRDRLGALNAGHGGDD
jgi:Protein of unknown function (DUF3263)